eukprot:TRINITY_DN20655_c0_g1_i1.p1 TRINITY_DN20655_c0_g1~~TRINITY_DN20655_c0_g1_i1.p1  ORF type:complete len:740 (+),score=201.62 TRINITY_DN20655_c0_g1_i1:144-2363(+)
MADLTASEEDAEVRDLTLKTNKRRSRNSSKELVGGKNRSSAEHKTYVPDPFEVLRTLLESKDAQGFIMRPWFRYFDKSMKGRIDAAEFKVGMLALRYPGSIEGLWEDLDTINKVGDIGLDQVDHQEAAVWSSFRKWAASTFPGPREMIRRMKRQAMNQQQVQSARQASLRSSEEVLTSEDFTIGLQAFGWDFGFEEVLFVSLDVENESCVSVRGLKWLDIEVRRFQQKEAAKKKAKWANEQKAQKKKACQIAMVEFKAFIKRQYGSLFRAWRKVLDPNGSMSVQRPELFKACRSINWKGDVRALWKALDHDGGGVTYLEELDPSCAQLLAQFHEWTVGLFGPKPSAKLWHAFDRQRRMKLSYSQFAFECEQRGFTRRVKTLASWLDWQDNKFVQEEDLNILDTWKPPEYLVAKPNFEAATDFKKVLLHKHGHMLKAWRSAMDRDNTNSCNWHEFQEAAKHIRFAGEVAGAWLALDQDVSGSIALKEMDRSAHDALKVFKRWADEEFGGVRSAFRVLDTDQSNKLSFVEFRHACLNYGFPGDVHSLFASLDQHSEQMLHYKDVCFLDDWDVESDDGETGDSLLDGDNFSQARDARSLAKNDLLDYDTRVPGPGAYDVLPGFGAMPSMPTVRHGGAYSFSPRRPQSVPLKTVGPAVYMPSVKPVKSRKPSWGFGTAAREGILSRAEVKAGPPGPGAYDIGRSLRGPQFSMRPRRGMRLHPSQKTARPPEICANTILNHTVT